MPVPPNLAQAALDPRFQGAKAVYRFSDVFFNRERTVALVYASVSCGFLCGNGGWRVLEKSSKGEWSEVFANCSGWVA